MTTPPVSANTQKAVRVALMRELETINHYQELHDLADDPEVRELLLHLMDEEKEHVAELTTILRRIDERQDSHFRSGHAERIEAGGAPPSPGEKPPPPPETPQTPPSVGQRPTAGGLTVGSLISARSI